MIRARRRTTLIRIGLVLVAILLASSATAVRATSSSHLESAVGDGGSLRGHVVRLFDQLDRVSRVIEGVRTEIGSAREQLRKLSRSIEAQQQILNLRAAEAYVGGFADGIESMLGASSVTDLRDAVEFLDAISQRDQDVLVSLERRKTEIEWQRIRLEALEAELRQKRQRLEVTVADLVEQLQRQQAAARSRAVATAPDAPFVDTGIPSPSPAPSPAPSPPPTPALSRAAVAKLVRDEFTSLGSEQAEVALCVAEEESDLDPRAVNPATGAGGLFQFMPSTWASLSDLAGWQGASVFDARANAAVAAWTVATYGWHPWRSVAEACAA